MFWTNKSNKTKIEKLGKYANFIVYCEICRTYDELNLQFKKGHSLKVYFSFYFRRFWILMFLKAARGFDERFPNRI